MKRGPAPRRLLRALAAIALIGGGAAAVRAQTGAAVPAPVVPAAQPAPLDTLTVAIAPFAGAPDLRTLRVEPDSVVFGDIVRIVVAGPGPFAAADSLVLPSWLEPLPDGALVEIGDGATLAVRVYAVNPFRVTVGSLASGVVSVRGRGTDGSQTAPVRSPRSPGWDLLFLAVLLAVLVLAALVAQRIWRRRRGPRPRPGDLPVRGAAWPQAAVALAAVLRKQDEEGDARAFLDGLAGVTRGYVAARFGIPGREMTGDEIAAACRELGHPAAVGRAFAQLLGELDGRRYDPRPVDAAWCRERAAELLAAIAAARIEPGPTPLPPAELAAGRDAWDQLVRELAVREGGAA